MTTRRRLVFLVGVLLVGVLASVLMTSSGAVQSSGIAARSTGCDSPEAALAGISDDGTLMSGGGERLFDLSVPPGAGADPLPVVVDMHGAFSNREVQSRATALAELGRDEGFITVAPQAMGQPAVWRFQPEGPDVRFINDLLDEIESRLCVDTDRLYLTGFSMGGMMSLLLACNQADRFAAVAPVGGTVEIDPCEPNRPVPLVVFHGSEDETVAFDGELAADLGALVGYTEGPSVPEIAGAWAQRNGCAEDARVTRAAADVELASYDCPEGGQVDLYTIEGGRHGWPGSKEFEGETTMEIDASEVIWEFFERQSLGGPR